MYIDLVSFYFSNFYASVTRLSKTAKIHKLHHDFKAPFGITAIYAHPLEHVVSNIMPIAAGPVILQW